MLKAATEHGSVTYLTPLGVQDFHRVAERLAREHPRDMRDGSWFFEYVGKGAGYSIRFTWQEGRYA